MLKRSLIALVLFAMTTAAAAAREPVVVKTKVTSEKDQSRVVSAPWQKSQKFSDYVASETP